MKRMLIVVFLILSIGCSGGGEGDGGATTPIQTKYFDLNPAKRYKIGFTECWDLLGTATDNNGNIEPFVGVISTGVVVSAHSGYTYTQIDSYFQGLIGNKWIESDLCFTNDQGGCDPVIIDTFWYDPQDNPYCKWDWPEVNSAEMVAWADPVVELPHDAQIGETGDLSGWQFTTSDTRTPASTFISGTWSLTAHDNNAMLTFYEIYEDAYGWEIWYREIAYVINEDGDRLSGEYLLVEYTDGGHTFEADMTARQCEYHQERDKQS